MPPGSGVRTRTSFIHIPVMVTGGYVGPGDIVSGAVVWYGLRAYTAASIGSNAIRLRENGGNTEQDFATISGGGLDIAAITTFKGANSLFIVKFYDQSGNGIDLVQATAGDQAPFTLSAIGSLPAIDTRSTNGYMTSAAATAAQPFTISSVYNHVSGDGMLLFNSAGSGVQFRPGFAANSLLLYAGNLHTIAGVSDSSWHAVQGFYNGASSDGYVDGSSNTGDAGASAFGSAAINFLALSAGTNPFVGFVGEIGVWAVDFAGNKSRMNANQHAYWGF